ncbi:3-hydroxybutyryl-CoA dehydrogenase [Burkholderia sp. SRS-W-2-2016]|uniref:3-hydroxybutyryl-CoA dehydrogenase n=1 Tax=Burkholderia sp. SRS-W-2-2016 TaxID=1926878 RepID=UPI00094B06D9|nr:3-hydroxybutyryl-CoA dehydrogenase [Burkholderia sp. SRS-W-2-2016]OLL31032.1 3-hydroxybutyryl-CoA dehydrogenase [Burkholderia sp. SRS-W-2-2016]
MTIGTLGIVGAGQMGCGIAHVCAAAGINVVLNDIDETAIRRGMDRVAATLDRMVSKANLTAEEASAIQSRITGSAQLSSLGECDMVIEAATENEKIKQDILRRLDSLVRPDAIVATNTSSLSVSALAAALSHPDRFIGMHFFSPVPMMRLIEVIRGAQTSDATFDSTVALAKRIGKTPIDVKNSPGFVVNRILVPMINEAIFALHEKVASAEEIDAGMKLGANHPVGPLALADLIGLDTVLAIMNVLCREFNDQKYRPAPLLEQLVDAGDLGRKSGRGIYTY